MSNKQKLNINDFMTGTKVLEEVESLINGKIRVIKSIAFGTYIQVNDLTQSGGVVYDVWKTTLKKVKKSKSKIQNCLILGLGGGSAAKLIRKYWPASSASSRLDGPELQRGEPLVKITGIDIDPIMVELGKKYLGLDKLGIKIDIGDAFRKVQNLKSKGEKYDLILVDTYLGDDYPEKFESEKFLKLIKGLLSRSRKRSDPARGGRAVFNRLYSGEKRPEAMKFLNKLGKIFSNVEPIYPEANIMFVCS
jgi:spermidine synthase